ATAQDCEIKLGVAGPMTGGGSSWGLSEKAAVEFEAAYTNANGGLQVGDRKCKVAVVSVDAQSTAAGGAAASNYLASQGVPAVIVGPNDQGSTDPGNAVAKVYNETGVKASTEWYQRGTTNFAPIVVRLMGMNPDTVELAGMPPGEASILVKQMREAGYEGAFG